MQKVFFHFLLICFFSLSASATDKGMTREQYIALWKDEAVYQMVLHKIPASITLAQGILESGDGNSRLAREGNNHFGIKCHSDWTGERIYEDDETKGECFRQYDNARDSYEDHSEFLERKRYESLFKLEPDDYKGWARGLKECGYATNPSYPQLLIKIIEEFELHQYDEEGKEYLRKNKVPNRPNGSSVPPAIDVASKEKQEHKPKGKTKKPADERASITISNNREVYVSDNKIKFIRAKAGDTPESIARDLELHVLILCKFNDFGKSEELKEGDVVYLQPKRNRSSEASYTIKKGDTLKSISQNLGVKQKRIMKLNGLKAGQDLSPGKELKLKK